MRRTYWMSVEQLATIVATLMLASCVRVHAQFGVEQPFFFTRATVSGNGEYSLTNIPNTVAWWVASDITSQSDLTNNGWKDRIGGVALLNDTKTNWPLWQTNYVVFNKSWLSNNLPVDLGGYDAYALWWVVRVTVNPWWGMYLTSHLSYHNYDDLYWNTTVGLAALPGITNQVFHNLLFSDTNTTTHQTVTWTNGVQASYYDSASALTYGGQMMLGNPTFPPDANGWFYGKLYEIAVFTNMYLVPNLISNLNYRATNIYGINP